MNDSKTIVALDIGTGKMQVFIGEIIDGKMLNIVGMGQSSSADVKKGDILDVRKAASSAQEAITSAEKSSGVSVRSVCLGISGTHIKGFRNWGSANVSGSDNIVRQHDVDRACEDAQSKTIPEDKVFIHNICCGYYLDGEYCPEPLGMKGAHLEAEFYMLYGDKERIRDAMHVVESFGMDVEHLVLNGLATARMTTTAEQRQSGALVLDIGCGTTDYAFFKHGKVMQAGVIPVGGDHFTNDLSYGLRISRKNAEKLKRRYGKLILNEEEAHSNIWTEGDKQIGDRSIPMESINRVLALRLEELFEIVKNELEDFFLDSQVREIILSGGTSKMFGMRDFAESYFGIKCSETQFNSKVKPTLCYPEYAAGLGLLDYALSKSSADTEKKPASFLKDKFTKIFKL